MASYSDTALLDLAQTVSNAALTITKAQLQEQATVASPGSSAPNGVNGHANGNHEAITGTSGVKKAIPTHKTPAKETQDAKVALVQAATELRALALGPLNYLTNLAFSYHEVTALSVVIEFDIAFAVPLEGDISFQELSKIVGFDAGRLERVLRVLFITKIFAEPRPGFVSHTPISEVLVRNKPLTAFLGHCTGEAFQAGSRLKDSIRKYPQSEGPTETGFNLAFNTPDPLFTFLNKDIARFDRFNLGMAGISEGSGRTPQQVIDGYDWASLGNGQVVDVGGGNGHISIALAEAYSSLTFVVQDLPGAIASADGTLPPTLSSRITFQAHDMFTPQPVIGASAYHLRHILHDWPDSHAILILQALVPALRNGSKVLISDSVVPPPGVLKGGAEKFVRYLDMQMMVLHNARERTEQDFRGIFEAADQRLRLRKVWTVGEGGATSHVLEAEFVDEQGA